MEQQNTALDEVFRAGSTAVKTIRSLKGASTGAAGGPLGALAGIAWENRHGIKKAVLAICSLLMIPVLFLVMLPSLIFGDLTTSSDIWNNNGAISGNIQNARSVIVEVLTDAHTDITAEITAKIHQLPEGDTASINDPYLYSISVNANQLISQFCASKNQWNEINLRELKRVIASHQSELFSYTEQTQTHTIEVTVTPGEAENSTSSESAAPVTKTVTVTEHIFTVTYQGDSYFADHVFELTDKQKALAADYAENLAIFLGTGSDGIATANVSAEVLAYRPVVERLAARFGMESYVELILAVMMQESGGRGSDPMQAAEGGFNTRYPHVPNGITDPEYSIECGIQELKYALDKAGCTGPTDLDRIKLALQGYNYGSGYIDWAMERDGGYTRENAIAYSDMMCARPGWHYSVYGDKEYVDHVLRYYIITAGGNGTYPANGMQIPHYLQTDYGNIPYGGGSIASSGCGPTSFAMIASYLTGTQITPVDAVSWCGNSYYMPGVGTYWSYFQAAASHFNCGSVRQTNDPNEVLHALSSGHPVISSQRAGLFTSGGHFIVLRGVTASGKVLVNDPNDSTSKNYINREFNMMSEIHVTANAYWIFDSK